MEYGAIDLHLKKSLIRIVDGDGVVVLDRTIATTRAVLTQVFGGRAPLRVLLESGHGERVGGADARGVWARGDRGRSELRADVWPADAADQDRQTGCGGAGRGLSTGHLSARRIACRRRNGRVRRTVRIREQLVRVRTQTINLLRAQLRQEGLRLPAGGAETVGARLTALDAPARRCAEALAPLRDLLAALAPLVAAGDAPRGGARRGRPGGAAADDGAGHRADHGADVSGDGRHVSSALRDAGASTAYLGLVPREDSSGTRQRKGAITKAGPGPVRALAGSSRVGRVAAAAGPRGAARLGRARERRGGASASRSSRSRAGWRGFSTRCGAMGRCIRRSRASSGGVSGPGREAQPPDGVMSTVRSLAALTVVTEMVPHATLLILCRRRRSPRRARIEG